MTDTSDIESKPDGKAFDDFFESIGAQTQKIADGGDHPEPAIAATTDEAVDQTSLTDDEPRVVDEIESLCMNCHENGVTRLLLTRIPFFREIILMSFFCPHCSFKNSEIQSAGSIQPRGLRSELRLTQPSDFARQVVKSDTAIVKFVELDVEVPPGRGQLTNVEGMLSMVLEDLEVGQDARREAAPEVFARIGEIIVSGRRMLDGEGFPFRLVVDDPAGNSTIEPEQRDGVGKLIRTQYSRTPEQNEALGLGDGEGADGENDDAGAQISARDLQDVEIVPNEVYSFPATCPGCTHHCVTHMKMVDIPHFKQVVIMSTVCEDCGYRSNEVKTGGEVPEKGKKITLRVENEEDLARDILKSESCALECPELSLSVNPGTLGGRFTTVEGLLTQVRDDLHQQIFDMDYDPAATHANDSIQSETAMNWKKFFEGIDAAIKGEKKFTIVLQDPLASSYVQDLRAPERDEKIEVEEYERTEEEEEDLGLRDMRTEGYEADHAAEVAAKKAEADGEAAADSEHVADDEATAA